MFDDADFQLVWPPELFIREATRLLRRPSADEGDIRLLLEEAFAGQTPIDRFNAKPSAAALQRMKAGEYVATADPDSAVGYAF